MEKKSITFLLKILKSTTEIQINNWLIYFDILSKENNSNLVLKILFNSEQLPSKNILSMIENSGIQIIDISKLEKQTDSIFYIVKNKLIETDYLKICYPFDFIHIEQTIFMIKEIVNQDIYFFNFHNYNLIDCKNCEANEIFKTKVERIVPSKINNSSSIYVVQDIFETQPINYFTIFEDIALAMVSLTKNRKVDILNYDFYISGKNINEKNILKKDEYKDYYNYLLFLGKLKSSKNIYKTRVKKYLKIGLQDLKFLYELIYLTENLKEKRNKSFKKGYKQLRKIANSNKHFFIFYKIYILFKIFFSK